MPSKTTQYGSEALAALYKSLMFCEEYDLPCQEIKAAIEKLEAA